MKKTFLGFLIGTCTLLSCKKETANSSNSPVIYVAGYEWDSIQGNDRATVWKNNLPIPQQLSTLNDSYLHALAISGQDIYCTGFENQPGQWKCHVWKNGQLQYTLGNGYSVGNGIAFVNNEVYTTGMLFQSSPRAYTAILWKNQLVYDSLAHSGSVAAGNAIAVSGTDIHIVGSDNGTAQYWKNGISQNLLNSSGFTLSCIKVTGNDVYIGGYTGNQIRYWKNGNPVDIAITPGSTGYVTGIDVAGTDVYLCGWEFNGSINQARYWKNGTMISLGNGTLSSRANGIVVKNGNIYVAGEQRGAGTLSDYACTWTNGMISLIGKRNSRAMAIVVQ